MGRIWGQDRKTGSRFLGPHSSLAVFRAAPQLNEHPEDGFTAFVIKLLGILPHRVTHPLSQILSEK